VAFFLATGARQGETDRAWRVDVDMERQIVFLRGTKIDAAPREIPLVGAAIDLMAYALRHAEGADGLHFCHGPTSGAISTKPAGARREHRRRKRSRSSAASQPWTSAPS
jgi:hypothetical protein